MIVSQPYSEGDLYLDLLPSFILGIIFQSTCAVKFMHTSLSLSQFFFVCVFLFVLFFVFF